MARIQVAISDDEIDRVQDYSKDKGYLRPHAYARLIRIGLAVESERSDAPEDGGQIDPSDQEGIDEIMEP